MAMSIFLSSSGWSRVARRRRRSRCPGLPQETASSLKSASPPLALVNFGDVREFFAAGRAPGAPEIQQHDRAAEAGQAHRRGVAGQRLQLELAPAGGRRREADCWSGAGRRVQPRQSNCRCHHAELQRGWPGRFAGGEMSAWYFAPAAPSGMLQVYASAGLSASTAAGEFPW